MSYLLGAFNLVSHEFVRSRSALIFRGTGIRHARSWDGKGGRFKDAKSGSVNVIC